MTILVMLYIGMVTVVAAAVSHQKQILRFLLRMTETGHLQKRCQD
jgi:hypothetical protein